MADVVENEAKMAYMKPSGSSAASVEEPRGPSKGFVVREAPWTTGNEKVTFFLCMRVWHVFLSSLREQYFVQKMPTMASFLPVNKWFHFNCNPGLLDLTFLLLFDYRPQT